MNYANIAGASTYATKLKSVYLKQKHAVRILFNKGKLTHSNPHFENLNALNVYQININQHLNFMIKFINYQNPSIFSDISKRPDHKYSTNFSQSSFYLKRYSLNSTKLPVVDVDFGMMLLIKKRRISNLILAFKRKLNQS